MYHFSVQDNHPVRWINLLISGGQNQELTCDVLLQSTKISKNTLDHITREKYLLEG